MRALLQLYSEELENELYNILEFWNTNTFDNEFGGFFGGLDNSNNVFVNAPKGFVLNSRILWTFSSAYILTKNPDYLHTAEKAFNYIKDHFIDKKFGGGYWSVDHKGNPLDSKKQIYALAFAIYGLSEFYIGSKNEEAKTIAIELYNSIVRYSYDKEDGGYIEALTRDWKEIDDLRLSEKDANEKKSMNTHLHVLEGFANLYRIWPDENLKKKITELIYIFLNQIIDPKMHHLILFFDEKWNNKSQLISYGHDIEAAWLIQEAAEIICDKNLLEKVKEQSVMLADAVMDGIDKDGGLWYEYNMGSNDLVEEKHWWPQAESMIGFFNVWQITGEEEYLQQSLSSWDFVQKYIIDKENGEWFWGVKKDNTVMDKDKVGIWKGPYHSGRACMEIIKRINKKSD